MIGFRNGFLRSVYRLVSFVAAIIIARQFYPYIARMFRNTELFTALQTGISNILGLNGSTNDAYIIENLPLPAVLQNLLHNYNIPSMYDALQAETIQEYVSAFFANMVINGLSMVIVFTLTMLVMFVVGIVLDVVSKLPVIHTLNQVAGCLFSIVTSLIVIWIALVVAALFVAASYPVVYSALEGSWVVQRMFEVTLPQLARV